MHSLVGEWHHLIATRYVGVASYVFLIYDIALTFADEVEYIWRGRKGPIIYLFFLNRYFFPLAFIINIYAYMSRSFSHEVCKHIVLYEGATAIVAFGVTGLMMIVRVNALYAGRSRTVQVVLVVLWLAQIGIYSWLLSTGIPVPHSAGLHSCTLLFDPNKTHLAVLCAVGPLVFDTAVVIFTLYKTFRILRQSGKFRFGTTNLLMRTLVTDGVMYFAVVCTANLAWTVMILKESPGVKNVIGQFTQLITVTMMSRITLHLRKVGADQHSTVIIGDTPFRPSTFSHSHDGSRSGMSTECETMNSEVSFATPTPMQSPPVRGVGREDVTYAESEAGSSTIRSNRGSTLENGPFSTSCNNSWYSSESGSQTSGPSSWEPGILREMDTRRTP